MTKPTGVGRGGRRDRAGRPKGAATKRSRERLERAGLIAAGQLLPLDWLLARLNDPALPPDDRDRIAAIAAPFCHPRLAAVAIVKRPSQMTDMELTEALRIAEEDKLRAGIGRGLWPRLIQ